MAPGAEHGAAGAVTGAGDRRLVFSEGGLRRSPNPAKHEVTASSKPTFLKSPVLSHIRHQVCHDRDMKRWGRLAVVGFFLFVLLSTIALALRFLGLSEVANIAQVVSLAPLVAPVVAWGVHKTPAEDSSSDQISLAADALARRVEVQWHEEAITRGLYDPPVPLAVRWRPASFDLTDHPENGGGFLSGSTAEASRLAASFSQLTRKRLVILGAPGSGKTTLAVLLLLALLAERESGDLVPVLVSAASWDPSKEHMRDWLIRELDRIYEPPQRGASRARVLLNKQKLIPIVDGLDELHESKRSLAIRGINQALDTGSPVILTCREREYEAAVREGDVLTSAAVITAEPLRPDEVAHYLTLSSPPFRMSAWKPVFDRLMDPGDILADAFSTALNVWLARQVYSDSAVSPEELTDSARFPTTRHVQDYLISAFIRSVYPPEPPPPRMEGYLTFQQHRWSDVKVSGWLGFLASHLERMGSSDLAWWRLRDAVSPVGVSIVFGILGGIVFGAAGELKDNAGYACGLIGAVSVGCAAGFRKAPEPRYLDLRGHQYFRSTLRLLGRVSTVGLSCWIAGGAIFGVAFGAIGGLTVGAIQFIWVSISPDEARGPTTLLRLHRKLFFRNLLAGGLLGACVGVFASPLIARGYLSGATTGLLGGLMIGAVAASPWIGYRVAHGWLAIQGKIPWRLITFLDDSYRRSVMRQVGAAYQFRHLQLQKRLATDVSYRRPPAFQVRLLSNLRLRLQRRSLADVIPAQPSDRIVDLLQARVWAMAAEPSG